jgi:hypothetical protein
MLVVTRLAVGAEVVVSSGTAPPGSIMQVKFTLARPQAMASGVLRVNFDPAFFGDVVSVAGFSAAGDAEGWATVEGRRVEVHLKSPAKTIGVVNGSPIIVMNVPVIALEGAKADVAGEAAEWVDATGNKVAVTVSAGTAEAGGTLAVREVWPATGVVEAGSIIRVLGSGFTAETMAQIEGVAAVSEFVDAGQINIVPSAPMEITGKRVSLRQGDESLEYFPAPATSVVKHGVLSNCA